MNAIQTVDTSDTSQNIGKNIPDNKYFNINVFSKFTKKKFGWKTFADKQM